MAKPKPQAGWEERHYLAVVAGIVLIIPTLLMIFFHAKQEPTIVLNDQTFAPSHLHALDRARAEKTQAAFQEITQALERDAANILETLVERDTYVELPLKWHYTPLSEDQIKDHIRAWFEQHGARDFEVNAMTEEQGRWNMCFERRWSVNFSL